MSKIVNIRKTGATYSVPVDETALAEGPIILARQGRAVAVIISSDEYATLQEQQGDQARRLEDPDRLEPDRQAFRRLLPELLRTHRGQFVAIHDGQLVDADPDEIALARRVFARRYDPVYMQEVTEEPHIYELSSPETVWHAPL
jgi:hypothetical protein